MKFPVSFQTFSHHLLVTTQSQCFSTVPKTWARFYYQNFECKSLFGHFGICLFLFKIKKKNKKTPKQTRQLPLCSNFTCLSVSIFNLKHYFVFSRIQMFSAFLSFLEVVFHLRLSSLTAFFLKQRLTQPACSLLPLKTGRYLCHCEVVSYFFLNSVEVNFQHCSSRPNCKVPFLSTHFLHIAHTACEDVNVKKKQNIMVHTVARKMV